MKKKRSRLHVLLHHPTESIFVGVLTYKDGVAFFEYDSDFLKRSIDLSPFYLPLKGGVFSGDRSLFDGLFGLFNDSLPDGWGRLLIDRKLRRDGIELSSVTPLDRLSFRGMNGMGALQYQPDNSGDDREVEIDLDSVAAQVKDVLAGESEAVLDHLIALNGSSVGARPKMMVAVSENRKELFYGSDDIPENFSPWIIKFRSHYDVSEIASIEYAYSLMAVEAGIEMSQTHLFTTELQNQYFGIERFDRVGKRRIPMHSLSGLLHADHRLPALDYKDILKATLLLTKDMREVEKVFRLAVFNVFAHNRDDHAKNFSFIMDEEYVWHFSPSYDLTFSFGPHGEHATTVMGEGRMPRIEHLIKLGTSAGLAKNIVMEIVEQVREGVNRWSFFADQALLDKKVMRSIQEKFLNR